MKITYDAVLVETLDTGRHARFRDSETVAIVHHDPPNEVTFNN